MVCVVVKWCCGERVTFAATCICFRSHVPHTHMSSEIKMGIGSLYIKDGGHVILDEYVMY